MRRARRRVSVVVVHKEHILGFHAEDPTSNRRYFFIPGGRIEEGESPFQAAIRETLEETGYHIEILPEPAIERRYDFEWDGVINDCSTVFLLGRLIDKPQEIVDDAAYHRGVEWIPLSQLDVVFAYSRDILEPVRELVQEEQRRLSDVRSHKNEV